MLKFGLEVEKIDEWDRHRYHSVEIWGAQKYDRTSGIVLNIFFPEKQKLAISRYHIGFLYVRFGRNQNALLVFVDKSFYFKHFSKSTPHNYLHLTVL